MIEVYSVEKGKEKTLGWIDGKKYLSGKKKKLEGYLDGNVAKHKSGYPLNIMKEDGTLTLNEDWAYEEMGVLKNGKVFLLNEDEPYYSLDREKKQIIYHRTGEISYLRGEGIDQLDDYDFFGILSIFFELFSGGGTVQEEPMELFGDDFWEDD